MSILLNEKELNKKTTSKLISDKVSAAKGRIVFSLSIHIFYIWHDNDISHFHINYFQQAKKIQIKTNICCSYLLNLISTGTKLH